MPYIGKSPSFGVRQRYQYTATAGQTTFSGTDLGNLTLTYTDANFVDVYQNGVLLKGGGNDYTATSGTSVVLGTGATADDVIEIIVYDAFSAANFFSRTDSDSRYLNVAGDTMTGSLDLNGTELVLDADADTSITADTDDQIDIKVGGTDTIKIEANGATTITSTADDSATGPVLTLNRASSSPADADLLGRLVFTGKNDAGEEVEYANINGRIRDASDGTEDGRIVFQTQFNGTSMVNRLDFDDTETVINEAGEDFDFRIEGAGEVSLFYADAAEKSVAIGSSGVAPNGKFSVIGVKDGTFGRVALRLTDDDSNVDSGNTMQVLQFSGDGTCTNGTFISFRDSAAEIGKINCAGGSSVSFNTTSDYRVKENIKPMSDAWDKIKAIKLINFTWKTNKTEPAQDGVIAHELQEIFPQAVSGEKDEMVTRADGTKDVELQGVDYGKLSTLLAKGLQEAMAKIETLEAKVTALESK